MLETGDYVPFAQHGGTGAARIAYGLVGKNNINTKYLVAGSNALMEHVEKNKAEIKAGNKKFCGTIIHDLMVRAIYESTLDKLKETNSYQTGSYLSKFYHENTLNILK